ncbi:unnamed protein product [Rotaria sordida]|uniref:ETS domain-containing protein n=1 Tax=Rotaria sordida TaxID=392033 RepID=A0A814QS85_9BILA|nr:unnamed protein product [Rotaria sordida]
MMDNNGEKLGIDILEDVLLSENDFDMFSDDPDLPTFDLNGSDSFMQELLRLSEELEPTCDVPDSSLHNMPINQKEWLVMDKGFKRQRPPRLYQFFLLLLENPYYASYASYTNKSEGIFQIHEPEKVADLWQQVKSRQANQQMTYDKLARAVRWYYQYDIMKKTNTRYTFQFSAKTLNEFTIDQNNNKSLYYSSINQ